MSAEALKSPKSGRHDNFWSEGEDATPDPCTVCKQPVIYTSTIPGFKCTYCGRERKVRYAR